MKSTLFKFIFGIIIVLFLGNLLFKGVLISNNFSKGKAVYVVKTPDFNGDVITYLCDSYIERDGCIEFKDEFGFEQKICQQYSVTKWK